MSQVVARSPMVINPDYEDGMGVYNMKLGMWIFLLSEVMFFTSLIGSYVILRFAQPDHFADPGVVLNVPLTAFNTFLLICSSVSMVKAFAAIQQGDQKGLKRWLLVTILIGATFVGIQLLEYNLLAAEHFVPMVESYAPVGRQGVEGGAVVGGPLYGATFYIMTGFHGAHVTLGVICLIFVLFQAQRGKYSVENHAGVEVIGLYWHFVDLVWIILFTIVYLI